MATVVVKLRPSSVEGRAGMIFYQVTHRRATQQITTGIHLQVNEWDAVRKRVAKCACNREIVQHRIDGDVALLGRIIKELEQTRFSYCVHDIIKRYNSLVHHVSFHDFMQNQIRSMRSSNRFGTARNYEKAMKNFVTFLGGVDIPFSSITEQLIIDYNAFLVRRGMVRNSISFYMRILRAVYNKAVRQKLVEQSHPFLEVYTGIDRTHKRAVPEAVISLLYKLQLSVGTQLALARDVFIFSYFTRGMAFVDIAYLKKENLQNGVITYIRRKTGQILSVKIEPSIQLIIDRYAGNKSPYVFPILTSTDVAVAYEQYQGALNAYNRLLGKLSKMLNCGCKLTSYTSRHSWATAARNHNVPISVISQGMGHSSVQTTQIYLTMLENSVIDEANRGIITSLVNGSIKEHR